MWFNLSGRPTAMGSYPESPREEMLTKEEFDLELAAFTEAVNEYARSLHQFKSTSRNYFVGVRAYMDQTCADGEARNESQQAEREAMNVIIDNIVPRTRREYVWDAQERRWLVLLRPL